MKKFIQIRKIIYNGNKKRITQNQKLILGAALGLILGIGGPFAIDKAYESNKPIFFTIWDSSNVLSYYGIILGSIATIIAVTMTINSSKKNERHKAGIEVAFKLIESCEMQRLLAAINDISIMKKPTDLVYLEKFLSIKINSVATEIYSNYTKLTFLYPQMTLSDELELSDYFVEPYYTLIKKLAKDVVINGIDNQIVDSKDFKDLNKLYQEKFLEFTNRLEKFITSNA